MASSPNHLEKTFTAQLIFTGRDDSRKAFANALAKPQKKDQYRVLNFYGMGGQGKTALSEQFTLSLQQHKLQNKQLGWAKLDFDISQHRSSATALLAIRLQLAEQCGISFPAFDLAFARYFEFTRPGSNLKDKHPELFKKPNDILQDIVSVIGNVVEEIPFGRLIYKYGHKINDSSQIWFKKRGKAIVYEIEGLDQHKVEEQLPKYLGVDLCDWLFDKKIEQAGNKRRLVILLDTYEALWDDKGIKTGLGAQHIDAWIRKLVEETPGILYLVLGREKLSWADIKPDVQPCIESHFLAGLSPEDADKFLQQVPIVEKEIRNIIVNSADGIPFYLDLQAKNYEGLKQQNISPAPNHFTAKKTEVLEQFVNHLSENMLRAIQIASYARFINEELIFQLLNTLPAIQVSMNCQQLTSFSFWKKEADDWYLHALMREYLQDRQQQQEPVFFNKIHQGLFTIYDSKLEKLEQAVDISKTHRLALMEAGYHLQKYDETKFPDWVDKRIAIFSEAYLWEQVEPLLQRSLTIREKMLGKGHPDVATSLNNLAALYYLQCKYEDAEALYRRSLTIREDILGKDHPDVAESLNNLAALYRLQGKYPEAEILYQRSLTIREEVLGKNHSDIATSLNNLAELYNSQGRYSEAEPLFLRSLSIREEILGKDHPDVSNSLNNLAELYNSHGRYSEAEPLFLRSLSIREEILGKDHPNVATSLNNLAGIYDSQGRYKDAESFYQRSLTIKEGILGKDHPKVAISLNNLAILFMSQGRYEDAEPLLQRSLSIWEEIFGKKHPDVATGLNNLAGLYLSQGRYEDAEPLCQRSLTMREDLLGKDHPDVAISVNILARLYQSQGKCLEAEPLFQQSLSILKANFPDGHPNLDKVQKNYDDLKNQM